MRPRDEKREGPIGGFAYCCTQRIGTTHKGIVPFTSRKLISDRGVLLSIGHLTGWRRSDKPFPSPHTPQGYLVPSVWDRLDHCLPSILQNPSKIVVDHDVTEAKSTLDLFGKTLDLLPLRVSISTRFRCFATITRARIHVEMSILLSGSIWSPTRRMERYEPRTLGLGSRVTSRSLQYSHRIQSRRVKTMAILSPAFRVPPRVYGGQSRTLGGGPMTPICRPSATSC